MKQKASGHHNIHFQHFPVLWPLCISQILRMLKAWLFGKMVPVILKHQHPALSEDLTPQTPSGTRASILSVLSIPHLSLTPHRAPCPLPPQGKFFSFTFFRCIKFPSFLTKKINPFLETKGRKDFLGVLNPAPCPQLTSQLNK